MNLLSVLSNWWCNSIIGPASPSKEVSDYVKHELRHVEELEKLVVLSAVKLERDDVKYITVEHIQKMIKQKKDILAVFEQMYPGIIGKSIN